MKRFIISSNIQIFKGGRLLVGLFRNPKGINIDSKPIEKDQWEINFDELLTKDENIYIYIF